MEKEDLRYLAKIVRRHCKANNYVNVSIIPDYDTGHIEVNGLPNGVSALMVCKVLEEKGIKIIGRGDNKVLLKF